MKIITEPDMAGYGWVAVDDDTYNGPGSPIGTGRTATEAYRELLLQLHDRGEPVETLLREEFGEEDAP